MNVSIDTRTLQPGDIFIPIKGPNFDGHDYIDEAIAKGASQILDVDLGAYAKAYRKKLSCPIIAITGSAGKTTAKEMLKAVLSVRFNVVSSFKNYNNEIGVPLTLLQADASTDVLIVEMGMRARGEIGYLTQMVRPTHSVITNVGYSHIELLGSQRQIALAKAEIFRKPLKWEVAERQAFVLHGTPHYDVLAKKATQAGYTLMPYSGQTKPDETLNLCYLVGRQFGMNDTEIAMGLSQYKPIDHRMQTLEVDGVTIIDDAYNANPDGFLYALEVLKEMPGRKRLVMGDMLELGDAAESMHQMVVDRAFEVGVDVVVTLGDLSKSVSAKMSHVPVATHEAAVNALRDELAVGDVVLVKGSRGMALEHVVEGLETWAR